MANLSIVTPGGCNAKRKFCFWEQKETPEDYLINLSNSLIKAKKLHLKELSITGGEPTISPYLPQILEAVKMYNFKKVVLTTNGVELHNVVDSMRGIVNHINISRHHYDDEINK
jgi:molybdenum cofactor biosynthesis enzyme MoaA